jgi:hypothetical protein
MALNVEALGETLWAHVKVKRRIRYADGFTIGIEGHVATG